MRSAVVVVPRERFTSLPVSLRSLFSTISDDVPVVVVEGGTPAATRQELEGLLRERPFDLVSLPFMVKPNEARNLGVARTTSEYVVIADNDIEYERERLGELPLGIGSPTPGHLVLGGSQPRRRFERAGAAFYREVGAGAYVRQAEALLAEAS